MIAFGIWATVATLFALSPWLLVHAWRGLKRRRWERLHPDARLILSALNGGEWKHHFNSRTEIIVQASRLDLEWRLNRNDYGYWEAIWGGANAIDLLKNLSAREKTIITGVLNDCAKRAPFNRPTLADSLTEQRRAAA